MRKISADARFQFQHCWDYRILPFLCLLIFLSALFSCELKSRVGLGPGERPPPFSLPDLDGHLTALESLSGKVVLLNFWASWCGPCLVELPELQRLYETFSSKGFVIIAVASEDDRTNVETFRAKYGLTFPILLDPDGTQKRRYQVTGYPETFLIAKDGTLVMVADSDENAATVRVRGPRQWSQQGWERQIEGQL